MTLPPSMLNSTVPEVNPLSVKSPIALSRRTLIGATVVTICAPSKVQSESTVVESSAIKMKPEYQLQRVNVPPKKPAPAIPGYIQQSKAVTSGSTSSAHGKSCMLTNLVLLYE